MSKRKRRLSAHQLMAIQNPCLLGEETAHPRFGYMLGTNSVVLTVNSGFE